MVDAFLKVSFTITMPTLVELYQHILWITAPLFFISAASLVLFIRNLVRLQRQSLMLSIPLRQQQDIEFMKAEPLILCLHGPWLTTRFGGLTYELSRMNGILVQGRGVWFRSRSSGFTTVTMELYRYAIPEPGRYRLKVNGLGARQDNDSEHSLEFARPHIAKSISYVIGIVLSSILVIGSLVFSLLRLTE